MNLNDLYNTQHVGYERDLEPPFLGLDDCPFDNPTITADDNDITYTRPCSYCGFTDCHHCPDTDSPYGHITARRGW